MALLSVHAVCLALALTSGEPRPLRDVVADLGSADYNAREAASDEIASSKGYSLAQIEGALRDAALTAEQRLRLERAGLRLFKDAPKGALGVEFTGATDITEISSVKKNFPASATLRAGDIITQIDGETVTARIAPDRRSSSVRVLVVSHEPGDEVPMVVKRNGLPVKLTVKFGDFADLGKGEPPLDPNFFRSSPALDEEELVSAWRQRLKRTTGRAEPAPIDATSLRPRREASWSSGEPIDLVEASTRARANNGEVPSVTAGAAPDHERQADRADQAFNGGAGRLKDGFGRAFNDNPWGGPGMVRVRTINDQRALAQMSDSDLAIERREKAQRRMAFAQIADQPGLNRAQRQQFRLMEEQLLQEINQLDREMERRKAAKLDLKPAPDPAPVAPLAPDQLPDQKADKP